MGVPLMVQNEVIGCLTLNNQEAAAYDQVEAALAQAFANQAAVAIQNAQLFEQVRAGHEQLQSLSHRLVQIQEFERRHIARELHDEAGQGEAQADALRLLDVAPADVLDIDVAIKVKIDWSELWHNGQLNGDPRSTVDRKLGVHTYQPVDKHAAKPRNGSWLFFSQVVCFGCICLEIIELPRF